jgi:hypothetical protein
VCIMCACTSRMQTLEAYMLLSRQPLMLPPAGGKLQVV